MKKISGQVLTTIVIVTLFMLFVLQSGAEHQIQKEKKPGKELYLPDTIEFVPVNNDFSNNESEFSFQRMVESDDIALFWHKEYGDNPMTNPDEKKRFDPQFALSECNRFYNYYVDELEMVKKGHSLTDKYKMLVIVFGGKENTAFGGGLEDKIGVLWTPATRINKTPYGALAHEMAHSFQYISGIDANAGPMGPIMEMSAQYMLWQVYPEWMTFENYHLVDFMKGTHYAFLHAKNMYHSPYVLEYWSEKHGKKFFGNLCRNTQKGEDPVATYKRMNSLTQEQFNDEMFDASRRFITWDLKRVEAVSHQYANQHYCKLDSIGEGWYRIAAENCPQNYGYNGIKLNVPAAGTQVVVDFKGIAGAEGFNAVKTELKGWRYGFLASLKDGSRVYGDIYRDTEGKAAFEVPENTEYLWFVVCGAPAEHWSIVMRWGRNKEETPEEMWPYQIKLAGTSIATMSPTAQK